MSSIVGLDKNSSLDDAYWMLDRLNHRGPDAIGIYYGDNVYHNRRPDYFDDMQGHVNDDVILAHNQLSTGGDDVIQPLSSSNLVLVSDAEIYNSKQLTDKYNLDGDSSCEIILNVIEHHYTGNLKTAVLNALDEFDGDYAFCVYDYKDCMIVRDRMGVKPVYYSNKEDKFICASERKAFKDKSSVISLNPRQALYNGQLINVADEYTRRENLTDTDEIKTKLMDALVDSVDKRTINSDKPALLFSAGVDSTLIAVILKRLDVDFTAYTIGTANSQDLEFAKKVACDIDIPLKYNVITKEDVKDYFEPTLNAIEDNNLMKIGVGMAIKMASNLASMDDCDVILSGQGADELFAGYNRYKNKINSPQQLLDELSSDLNNMYTVNLERDDKAVMSNSIKLRVPFLDRNVVDIACQIPVKYLIDSPEDSIRKHILRDVAHDLGVPESIAYRPKKAAQYGTGIDKIIRKKLLKQDEYQKILDQY
ncbi:MAG: asparagine synthetase B [Methanosphaera sp.]|nr:asparagine synthetase B [Methanosphaera sp.]